MYMKFYKNRNTSWITGINGKVYQFTVHAFGLSSSPSVAMTAVQFHAKKHGDKWPLAEWAVRENWLVDDIWLMSDNKSELSLGIQEFQKVMKHMGISVHKWGTNCLELLEGIPQDKRAYQLTFSDGEGTAIKALGIV